MANSPPSIVLPSLARSGFVLVIWGLVFSIVFEVVLRVFVVHTRLAHVGALGFVLRDCIDFLLVCGLVEDCTHSRHKTHLLRHLVSRCSSAFSGDDSGVCFGVFSLDLS